MRFEVVIIGGGAAGLFCAAEAGKRGRSVTVIEQAERVGKKILISGGGRCNFTNVHTNFNNFVSQNPHFCKSALARYTPQDFIKLIKKHSIEHYEKKLGQLFCRDTSRRIVQMLEDECLQANVKISTNSEVNSVQKIENGFQLETTGGRFECKNLIIATGGLSFPKVGATGFGLNLARQFGLKIIEPRPSLVPLIFADLKDFDSLAGISHEVEASFAEGNFRENILFTHRGVSGPAILQISNYWQPGEAVAFNLLPNEDAQRLLLNNRRSRQELVNFLSQRLPARFAEKFCAAFAPSKPLNQLSNQEVERISLLLNNWQVRFHQTEGWHKAEVMLGGVSTDELSSKTMEAKRVRGLYFIGEVVDVTGWLGGYNFQWAWASAFAAAQAV